MSKPIEVLYEDNHLLAVNKEAGMLVQGDKTGDIPLVDHAKEYIKQKYQKPGAVFLGVVHRLDRPVSGVVIFARTSKALDRMNKLFRERTIEKTYVAITAKNDVDPNGHLIHWLEKNPKSNKTTAFLKERKGALKSELRYEIIGTTGQHLMLKVEPLTGRPHQIRVQLSSIGCPIRGDLKYGFPTPNEDGNINLHAHSLNFVHPVKKHSIKICAPLPPNGVWPQFESFIED